jgi:FkbM family methyltransferase
VIGASIAKSLVLRTARAAGVDLIRFRSPRHPTGRRSRLMAHLGIDLVIDVGANAGQFGVELRQAGYEGRIISLEPLSEPYRRLVSQAAGDPRWRTVQTAIGRRPGPAEMHVASNGGASSSFLAMLDLHARNAPEATYTGTETVTVMTLDDAVRPHLAGTDTVFLKLDVQGYELEALSGGAETLSSVSMVQLELSLMPLYESAPTYAEVMEYLHDRRFHLVGIETGFASPAGLLLQADGLFVADGSFNRLRNTGW